MVFIGPAGIVGSSRVILHVLESARRYIAPTPLYPRQFHLELYRDAPPAEFHFVVNHVSELNRLGSWELRRVDLVSVYRLKRNHGVDIRRGCGTRRIERCQKSGRTPQRAKGEEVVVVKLGDVHKEYVWVACIG